MAKTYITLKLDYNTTSTQIDVRLDREEPTRDDITSIRESISGVPYYQKTGERIAWEYSFDYADEDVFDFFNDAYLAFTSGHTVTFSRENDSGAFDEYEVIVTRPQYVDETVGTDGKVYEDLTVRILKVA